LLVEINLVFYLLFLLFPRARLIKLWCYLRYYNN